MGDKLTRIVDLKDELDNFVRSRKWEKFHNPKDLSLSISVEAAELLELFQWEENLPPSQVKKNGKLMGRIKEELADVLIFCLCLANALSIDISDIILEKIKRNNEKYPIEKYIGVAKLETG